MFDHHWVMQESGVPTDAAYPPNAFREGFNASMRGGYRQTQVMTWHDESQKLTKTLPEQIRALARKCIGMSVLEYRAKLPELQQEAEALVKKTLDACEHKHTAKWLFKPDIFPNEQGIPIVCDIESPVEITF